MKIICKIWVNAKNEDNAIKLLERLEEKLGKKLFEINVEPYTKINGFVISSTLFAETNNWNDSVVETIALAQKIGNWCSINGRINEEFLIGSNKTNISGIESFDLMISKQ